MLPAFASPADAEAEAVLLMGCLLLVGANVMPYSATRSRSCWLPSCMQLGVCCE